MNPWFLAYSNLTGMLDVAKPGAIIVTGRGNRYDPAFQEARKRGAKVYTYWNVSNAPYDLKNPEDAAQYLTDGKPPPAWPIRAIDGSNRSQWAGTYLLDVRPGSAWLKHIVQLTGDVVDKNKFDGFFLDTMGARTWAKLSAWESWVVSEQQAWADGNANLSRELAAVCLAHNPKVEIVHNNIWALPKTHPGFAANAIGEKACNGVCLENPSGNVPSDFHKNYAGHTFGRLPRRVLVIDSTDADTILWSKVSGVTHVCSIEKTEGETYAKVTPPVVPYTGWGDDAPPTDTCEVKLAAANKQIADLTAANTKLAQQNATLMAQLTDTQSKLQSANVQIAKLNSTLDQINKLSAPTL